METQKQVQFTEEEMEKIKEFQQQYLGIQMGFGQAEITRTRLETQLDTVHKALDDLKVKLLSTQEDESQFIAEINKKYGEGVLNPETGTFTPADNK